MHWGAGPVRRSLLNDLVSRRSRWTRLAFLSLIVAHCGCGRSDGRIAPVSGTVTYRGSPVANAAVVFAPLSGDRGSEGLTNADGVYLLSTFKTGDGTWIGEHRVAIISRGPPQRPPPGHPLNALPADDRWLPGKPLVPERYLDVSGSPLTAKVVAGRNTIDFAIED